MIFMARGYYCGEAVNNGGVIGRRFADEAAPEVAVIGDFIVQVVILRTRCASIIQDLKIRTYVIHFS